MPINLSLLRYHTIFLEPSGRKIKGQHGKRLLEVLASAGIKIRGDCGGRGVCGRCRVCFLQNAPSPTIAEGRIFSSAELEQGWRLACQHWLKSDIVLLMPPRSRVPQEKVKDALHIRPLNPKASMDLLEVPIPGSSEYASDLESLKATVGEEIEGQLSLLRELPKALREGKGVVTLVRVGKKVVAVEAKHSRAGLFGLAVDVGTSTVAGYLLDLKEKKELGASAIVNPQISYGSDVISRIAYVREKGIKGLEELQRAVVTSINHLVTELTSTIGIDPQGIIHLVLVGNPTMLHILLGVDPSSIGEAPFVPVWREALCFRAKEIGFRVHPQAVVELFPLVSGYLGADTVACILACRLHEVRGPCLLLDLGTNSEIVLGEGERILACSAAAGPAFEGGRISCGALAQEGAIAHFRLTEGELCWEVIGGREPEGICGTGIVDLVACLLEVGLVDEKGRLVSEAEHPLFSRVVGSGRGSRFQISEKISFTQQDIRELQLAKAAIRAGIEVLLERAGLAAEEIETVYLAGVFGSHMDVESLVKIGLLPKVLLTKVQSVGNAAGIGAKLALLDHSALEQAEEIARRIEYVELSLDPSFPKKFIESLRFPK